MKKQLLTLITVMLTIKLMAQTVPSYVDTNNLTAWYPFHGNAITAVVMDTMAQYPVLYLQRIVSVILTMPITLMVAAIISLTSVVYFRRQRQVIFCMV